MFDIARVRVSELEKITEVSKSNISRSLKSRDGLLKNNNRIIGIEPELVEEFLTSRGYKELYHPGIYVTSSQVGGTAKTSTTISLAAAYRRLASRKRPIVLIDTDSQGSLTSQLCGEVANDNEDVLVNYFEGSAQLEDILHDLGNGVFLIKSSLENIYLDRVISNPKSIKHSAKKLVQELFSELGSKTKIFVDTPPQLSAVGQSFFVCMAQLDKDVDRKVLIPIRCDQFSIRGARIAVRETKDALETFNLPRGSLDIDVFITNYDQRVKISVDTMRTVLEDKELSPFLCPVVVRYSSEFSKKAFNNEHIFSPGEFRSNAATSDYIDLLLYVMGWENEGDR